MLVFIDGVVKDIPHIQSVNLKSAIKIFSSDNLRSAIVGLDCMSVYLFNGNRRIIATEEIKGKGAIGVLDLCKLWVYNGTYNEADFAA